MAYYMYVSLQDDDKILVLGMDSATGELTPIAGVPAPGGPSSSATPSCAGNGPRLGFRTSSVTAEASWTSSVRVWICT